MSDNIAPLKSYRRTGSPDRQRGQQIAIFNYIQAVDVSSSDHTVSGEFTTKTVFICGVDGNVNVQFKDANGDTQNIIIYVNGYAQFICDELVAILQASTTATNIYLVY